MPDRNQLIAFQNGPLRNDDPLGLTRAVISRLLNFSANAIVELLDIAVTRLVRVDVEVARTEEFRVLRSVNE